MRTQDHAGRSLAILAGGVAAGLVGSRFLSPLVAAMMGRGRVRAGGDPFALLVQDHREIVSLLDRMAADPNGSTPHRSRLFLMLKRKLAKHAMAEEDVVYPIVHNDSANGDERKHLYDEHAEMKILLYTIEGQLRDGEDWSDSVARLRDIVLRHVDEEEKTVFPELRKELARKELRKVSGQIAREEALIV